PAKGPDDSTGWALIASRAPFHSSGARIPSTVGPAVVAASEVLPSGEPPPPPGPVLGPGSVPPSSTGPSGPGAGGGRSRSHPTATASSPRIDTQRIAGERDRPAARRRVSVSGRRVRWTAAAWLTKLERASVHGPFRSLQEAIE